MISRNSEIPMPVYYRLQSAIKEKIESGHWKPGDRIPPERVFADDHQLSVGTVKKAIANLVNEGYLYRIQGKGTFVAGTSLRRDQLRYYRYSGSFDDEEGDLKVKLLDVEKVGAIPAVNDMLALRGNQGLFRVRRVLFANDTPRVYTISYLPQKLFAGLDALSTQKVEGEPLYLILEERYGVPTIHNQELIGINEADKEVAQYMGIREGASLLFIEMLSFTYKQRPYEYRTSYCQTDEKKLFRGY